MNCEICGKKCEGDRCPECLEEWGEVLFPDES